MSKFKVLAGKHTEGGKLYGVGDVVDSKSNLLKFNRKHCPPKFAKATEEDEQQAKSGAMSRSKLGRMSKEDIQVWAEEEEIDLTDCTTRKAMLERIEEVHFSDQEVED